ncbi:hypothetical protein C1I99_14880 [Micromonospora deserti]|uniref:Uncharacterized protein n=1 Tax=Micromonospora deserti TaxID=2070366 RepID=A0A2W2DKQ7_9ACTN|nr:hypothetical protein C1I99_14880 [Micromonospora deserti]
MWQSRRRADRLMPAGRTAGPAGPGVPAVGQLVRVTQQSGRSWGDHRSDRCRPAAPGVAWMIADG